VPCAVSFTFALSLALVPLGRSGVVRGGPTVQEPTLVSAPVGSGESSVYAASTSIVASRTNVSILAEPSQVPFSKSTDVARSTGAFFLAPAAGSFGHENSMP
jgi:hypothetical protein